MNTFLQLSISLFQDESLREDYFLGAALVAMVIIAIVFLFVWSRRRR